MTDLTITTNTTAGYYLSNTAANPVTVAAGVTITNAGFYALGTELSSYWTIVNSGTLLASGQSALSDGIWLYGSGNGGAVTNTAGGSITGYYVGVSVAAKGTVVNQGTITTTGTSGSGHHYIGGAFTATSAGVLLGSGGVSNAGTGLISGYFEGVAVGGGGSVVNAGTIFGDSYLDGFGVVLTAGGSVTNAQGGVIIGNADGILTYGQAATVINQGSISGEYKFGVGLVAGGVVSNASTGNIYGYRSGIESFGTNSLTVTNASGGTITGGRYGVFADNDNVATVINAGVIIGYAAAGAVLLGGGTLDNEAFGRFGGDQFGIYSGGGGLSTITNAGLVYSVGFAGILLNSGGGLTNTGTVAGGNFGVVAANAAGTVVNAGSISAALTFQSGDTAFDSAAVQLDAGGAVTNSSGGVMTSNWTGVQIFGASGTVMNAGTILASVQSLPANTTFTSAGVELADGGVVTNATGGTIASYSVGVQIFNAAGTVVNAGRISDAAYMNGAGVQLADGGVVSNNVGGQITSEWMGVQIDGTASGVDSTVINQGTILAADARGDGAGVWIHGPGAITNAAGGLISGGAFGIVAYYQTTVVNQGTVFGTEYAFDARYPGFADRIIDTPGAVFSGTVSGGNTLGSTVYSTLELASGSSTGTITNAGTFVDFGQIALDAGASWSLGGSLVAGETIAFGGADASLILASPTAAAATIAGFAATDTIVLSGISDVTGLSFNGDTLTVSESGDAGLTLQFTAPQDLTYAEVGGSTDIFDVPCFLPGTHILTGRGEVTVEKLRVGDSIVTVSGGTRPLCWIGQGRALATRGRRGAATPVIVRKGALADNVPNRDLHITKGHSLYFDGVLIPVEFLVNHRSILWDDRAQGVTVFHLELDAHDVLIANGVASESYRDDGNRWLFQNANAGWDQPPKAPCAPVLTGGAEVDAIWRRILDRAGPRPGLPLTDDPDLHLVVDGVRVGAAEQQGSVWVFRLIERPTTVRIASREAVPAELGLARDARSLGVALRSIAVRQGTKFATLDAGDARLTDGFHDHEAWKNLRWTDGYATLPAEAFARFTGGVEVVLHVAETTLYPNDGTGAARVAA